MAVDGVTRACVARELDVDALVHYRPREGYIPIFARVARRPSGDAVDGVDDDGVFVVRLRESVEGVGEEGELKRAVKRDLADAFVVSTRVAAFGTTNGDAMTSEPVVGRVRSIDTTKWPPEFVIETTDGGKIRAWGRDACDADAYEAETRRRRDARALADADAVANALLEEEERERERVERAAEAKRCKAKKKKRSTSDAAPKRDADGDGEDDEAAALEREAKEKAAAEKAAAKAAARARQEEVKAAKAAREKAAKREAQKARKAAERAARETREAEEKAMVRDASGDENKEPKEEERSGDENKEPKEEERSSTKRPTGETVAEPTARVDAEPSSAQEKTKTPTATQLRKLEKERRKAQRMAEIDAFLKAHELTAAQEETESTGGARKRKNKKKKKPAAGAAARLEPASARPFSQEWFATFAVIAFFTVLAAAYTVVSFVVKKTTGAVA